jgi:hypothetical protein
MVNRSIGSSEEVTRISFNRYDNTTSKPLSSDGEIGGTPTGFLKPGGCFIP